MKFGHFDDERKEYVIQTPKTPYPWINYLGSENFFGLISNTAGGYCFYRDARMRRLMRYRYNNVPVDNGGRYFYLYDNGDFWTPGWMHVKRDLDFYECRHGLGYVENPVEEKWEAPSVINKTRALTMIEKFATDADVEKAMADLSAYWDGVLSSTTSTNRSRRRGTAISAVDLMTIRCG